MNHAVVHDKLFMRLQDLPVLAHMTYDVRDPYAVTVAFTSGGRVYAEWRLDRGMLRDGMLRPVGVGDVRMWPESDPSDAGLHIELCREVVFRVSERSLKRFLDRTYEAVPEGEERLDLDGLVDRLLADG
ncbi:SsgA family sporulation/cell division regulator [Streptomyces sp. NPDC047928]|uniref:SsgA family sporulation/cell division regulator n=1 Tax=unclassified Streptomyces TaxID=2593676 RepID=UPI00371E26E0